MRGERAFGLRRAAHDVLRLQLRLGQHLDAPPRSLRSRSRFSAPRSPRSCGPPAGRCGRAAGAPRPGTATGTTRAAARRWPRGRSRARRTGGRDPDERPPARCCSRCPVAASVVSAPVAPGGSNAACRRSRPRGTRSSARRPSPLMPRGEAPASSSSPLRLGGAARQPAALPRARNARRRRSGFRRTASRSQ